jgi:hypothetical protein
LECNDEKIHVNKPCVNGSSSILDWASSDWEDLYFNDIVFKVYQEMPYIGDSQYKILHNSDGEGNFEYYFLSDGLEKTIILYHEDPNDLKSNIYDITLNSYASELNEYQDTDEDQYRTIIDHWISPGESVDVSVNYWGDNLAYRYYFQNYELNRNYRLVYNWDDSNAFFQDIQYPSYLDEHFYNSIEKVTLHEIRNQTREGQIFKVFNNDEAVPISDESGYFLVDDLRTGDSFSLLMEEIDDPVFTDDTFEPDQGPLSANMDIIDENHKTSEIHSITCEINENYNNEYNNDWIQFLPWGMGEYEISLRLENAWYIEEFSDEEDYQISLDLIHSNGAETEDSITFTIQGAPVSPILSNNSLVYSLIEDNGNPLFLKIHASEEMNYSIIVEKLN